MIERRAHMPVAQGERGHAHALVLVERVEPRRPHAARMLRKSDRAVPDAVPGRVGGCRLSVVVVTWWWCVRG